MNEFVLVIPFRVFNAIWKGIGAALLFYDCLLSYGILYK